jgi:hypothetical protein
MEEAIHIKQESCNRAIVHDRTTMRISDMETIRLRCPSGENTIPDEQWAEF